MTGPRVLERSSGSTEAAERGPRPAVVDPRFRARRISVRRDAGRKRLKRLFALVAVAALALAAVVVVRSPVLDVDEVVVTGNARLDAADVQVAAGIERGAPLLLADLDAAAESIEALAWVAEVEVTRDLPGRVDVVVREREAAAVVTGRDSAVLVDVEGRVLDEVAAASSPFVQVVSPGELPAPGGTVDPDLVGAIELARRLATNPAGAVAAVRVEPTLRLELTEGATVDLGDATELDAKVEAFRTVHVRVDRSCLDLIDLTVPTHPVVTRDRGC